MTDTQISDIADLRSMNENLKSLLKDAVSDTKINMVWVREFIDELTVERQRLLEAEQKIATLKNELEEKNKRIATLENEILVGSINYDDLTDKLNVVTEERDYMLSLMDGSIP